MNCRTCLGPLISNSSLSLKEKLILDKTIEEIICFFVPEMKNSEVIGDSVCSECVDILQLFTKFIERCTIIEELLKEESFKALMTKIEIGKGINDVLKIIPSVSMGEYKTPDKTHVSHKNCLFLDKTSFSSKSIRTYGRKSKNTLEISRQEPLEVTRQTNIPCSENMGKSEESSEKLKNIVPSSTQPFIESGKCSDNNLDLLFASLKNDYPADEIIDISQETASDDAIHLEDIEFSTEASDQQCNTVITETDYKQKATSSSVNILETSSTAEDVVLKTNFDRNHIHKMNFSMFSGYIPYHSRVVSATQTSEEIDKVVSRFSNTKMNVVETPSYQNKNTKRIILLGTAFSHCPVCQVLFTSALPMRSHFKKVHSDLTFPINNEKYEVTIRKPNISLIGRMACSTCGKYFISRKLLASHRREVHKEYHHFKCQHCGKEFKTKYLYMCHLKNYNLLNTCKTRLCSFCKKKFDLKEFKAHMDIHRTLECEICKKRFLFSVNLNRHRLTHQNAKVYRKKKLQKELCNICGKFILGACNMRKHVALHSENRDYLCEKCSKAFKTKRFLDKHIKIVHDDNRDHECTICHRKMKECSLNFHMKLKHSMAYTIVCHICGKGFIRDDYYNRHMNYHMISGREFGKGITRYRYIRESESDFPCKFCGKVFKHVYNLRAHLLGSHLTYAPRLKCQYCDLTFKTSISKNIHERRHRDPRMYELTCKVCWNRFSSKERLETHSVKHEGSQRHKCNHCGEPFPSKFLLEHHKGQKHFNQKLADLRRTTLLREGLKDFIEGCIL